MANNYFGLILLVLLTAPIYNLLPKNLKIYFLLSLSLIIYALFNVSFLLILFFIIFLTFVNSFLVDKNKLGKYSLYFGCAAVLSPLIFYKYLLIWFDSHYFSFTCFIAYIWRNGSGFNTSRSIILYISMCWLLSGH